MTHPVIVIIASAAGLWLARKLIMRWQLSRAKHPSLHGHAKISRLVARLVPYIEYEEARFFGCDGAPETIRQQRKRALHGLAEHFRQQSPQNIQASEALENSISDVHFTNTYRVPFPFRKYIKDTIKLGTLVTATHGNQIEDIDGQLAYDLSGSYGVNIFGYEFYKACLDEGYRAASAMGPVLGPYHPAIIDNVDRLKKISGLDEVSFHMSGTEAVMQAVRLARYHTGRKYLVRFCGSYHGWWDGVQPGVGNARKTGDVFTLKDMDDDTLRVLRTRKDIACILINPLQALHPNANAPGDATLIASERKSNYDRTAYSAWLQQLREVCTARGIVMILDEVFVGFRLARGGAQEYFNVNADMVTYGKGLGGGLPAGVLCGKHALMKRFKDSQPTHISFARGTFNSHPYVMTSMNAFLRRIEQPDIQEIYTHADEVWEQRLNTINQRLQQLELPVRMAGLSSIWMVVYTQPGRYNWMYQYYLRAEGLALSWIGTGRFIFPHNLPAGDFTIIMDKIIQAADKMAQDAWWWHTPQLSNKKIKRAFLQELLLRKLGLDSHDEPPDPGDEDRAPGRAGQTA